MKKNNHGGKRPGAGRKPAPDKKVKVSFSLRPILVEQLKKETNKNKALDEALCVRYKIDLGE